MGLWFFNPQLMFLGDWRHGLPTIGSIQFVVVIELFQTRATKPSSQGSRTMCETQRTASSLSAFVLQKHSHNQSYTSFQSMPKNLNQICSSFPVPNKIGITTPLYVMLILLFFLSHLVVLPQAIILKADFFCYFNSVFYLLFNYN